MTIELNWLQKLKYYTFIYSFNPGEKMIKLQRGAIYNPVDQMSQNNYQWKACEKSDSMKQSKHKSNENKEKMIKL